MIVKGVHLFKIGTSFPKTPKINEKDIAESKPEIALHLDEMQYDEQYYDNLIRTQKEAYKNVIFQFKDMIPFDYDKYWCFAQKKHNLVIICKTYPS